MKTRATAQGRSGGFGKLGHEPPDPAGSWEALVRRQKNAGAASPDPRFGPGQDWIAMAEMSGAGPPQAGAGTAVIPAPEIACRSKLRTAAQPASRAASAIIWSENPAPPWR